MLAALVVLGVSMSRPVFQTIAFARFERPEQLQSPDWLSHRY